MPGEYGVGNGGILSGIAAKKPGGTLVLGSGGGYIPPPTASPAQSQTPAQQAISAMKAPAAPQDQQQNQSNSPWMGMNSQGGNGFTGFGTGGGGGSMARPQLPAIRQSPYGNGFQGGGYNYQNFGGY